MAPEIERNAGSGPGDAMHRLVSDLFPICRSITGNGVRDTLRMIGAHVPGLDIHEVPSGTKVFDWTVPPEWNIRDAYVATPDGQKLIDFAASNLHVVSYSLPVRERMTKEDILPRIHTLPSYPDWIPYRTAYYAPTWGFCSSAASLDAFASPSYDVVIDSDLRPGSLTYGEAFIPGRSDREILLSTHICHPSMANDNCSGMAVLSFLAHTLAARENRYSYRLLFVPGTIGAITWLAINEDRVAKIDHGLVIAGVGDRGNPTYKRSRRGNAAIDRAISHVLRHRAKDTHTLLDYFPYGYDERQYCSPGFDLPVGLFQKSRYGTFPEYHTSADDLAFITPAALEKSLALILEALAVIEGDEILVSTNPKCEPQLGKRGLYATLGGDKTAAERQMTMLWTLGYADGKHSLLDIAEKANVPFVEIQHMSEILKSYDLLIASNNKEK